MAMVGWKIMSIIKTDCLTIHSIDRIKLELLKSFILLFGNTDVPYSFYHRDKDHPHRNKDAVIPEIFPFSLFKPDREPAQGDESREEAEEHSEESVGDEGEKGLSV